ncbi:shikimate kinase [Enterococcus faecalis 13-SD-W-01]|nr:shikimate kinase [Enterococcus faecalis 13-SD-W-01]
MTIILIGFMGSGKTTIGRRLARKLDYTHRDLDRLFERQHQMAIPTFFERFGEEAFRQKETELLKKNVYKKNQVLSTGGGIILNAKNREILRKMPHVFFLEAPVEESFYRLKHSHEVRPLFSGKTIDEFTELYRQRYPFYKESANHVILTKGKSPKAVAEEIATVYRQKVHKNF